MPRYVQIQKHKNLINVGIVYFHLEIIRSTLKPWPKMANPPRKPAVGSPLPVELAAPSQLRRMLHRVDLPDVVSSQKLVAKNSILLLNARESTLDSHGDSQRRS